MFLTSKGNKFWDQSQAEPHRIEHGEMHYERLFAGPRQASFQPVGLKI
jgi:hypothetical protein